MAAPQYATLTIDFGRFGKVAVDMYLSDVANAEVNWDSGAGASSSSKTFYKVPANGVIIDFSIKTGMTDTTKINLTHNGASGRNMIRYANHLNTMAVRPELGVAVAAGEDLGAIQLA